MEWIDVKKELPLQLEEPHSQKLWLSVGMYGEIVGFFNDGKFMNSYACEILNVVAWMVLPKYGKD